MSAPVGGAVCVFAKCPIPGRSKTRLAPLLGEDGASGKPLHFDSVGYCVQFKLLVAVIGVVWAMTSAWCKSAVLRRGV